MSNTGRTSAVRFGRQMLVGPRHYRAVGVIAEEFGFVSMHVPDHLVYPAKPPTTTRTATTGR